MHVTSELTGTFPGQTGQIMHKILLLISSTMALHLTGPQWQLNAARGEIFPLNYQISVLTRY